MKRLLFAAILLVASLAQGAVTIAGPTISCTPGASVAIPIRTTSASIQAVNVLKVSLEIPSGASYASVSLGADASGGTLDVNSTSPLGVLCLASGSVVIASVSGISVAGSGKEILVLHITAPSSAGTYAVPFSCVCNDPTYGLTRNEVNLSNPTATYCWHESGSTWTDASVVVATVGNGGCRPPCELEKPSAGSDLAAQRSTWGNVKRLYE